MLRVGSNESRRAGWQKLPNTQWPRFRAAAGTFDSTIQHKMISIQYTLCGHCCVIGVLPDGRILLTGGQSGGTAVDTCETLMIHDRTRVTRTWSSKTTPSTPVVEEKKTIGAAPTPVVAAATTPTVPAAAPTATSSSSSTSAEAEKVAATSAPVVAAAAVSTPVTPAVTASAVTEVKEESKEVPVLTSLDERSSHTAVVMNGLYYMVGGVGRDGEKLRAIEAYDPTAKEWRDIQPKTTVTSKLATTLEWQGKIYVFDASEEADSQCFHKYDPEEKSWDKYAENIGIQYSHCVGVSVSRGLLMLGVATMNAKMFMMQLYEPDKDSWVVLPLMIPFTPNDCNIVAKVIDDKWLVLVGGNSESDKHNCYMIDWAKAVSSAAAAIVQGRADGTFDDELDDHPMAMFLYPQAVQAANEHWIPLPNYPLKCNLVSASAVVV
jgi:N-acetylneuraminic acid mutarotase